MSQNEQSSELLQHTSTIVVAHVANNPIAVTDVPSLIAAVHQALATLGPEEPAPKPNPAGPIPAMADHLIALGDRLVLRGGHWSPAFAAI